MDTERLQLLLHRYFDQLLTVAERAELAQMFRESARAREEFWELARWNSLLRQWGEAEWGRRDAEGLRVLPAPPQRAAKVTRLPAPWRWPLAAAAAVLLTFFFGDSLPWRSQEAGDLPDIAPKGVAVLTRASGVVWADAKAARLPGEMLQPGWLRLRAGAVQVEFARGARVVVEGPAEFQLVSDSEGFLQAGKLRAQVPEPAHGFQIRAPGFTVVDHGTEFACLVPMSAAPEVHVFTGSIAFQPTDAAPRTLREHQAVRLDHGQTQEIPARPDLFLSEEDLARREQARATDRLAAWRESSRTLSAHPAALVHLDFERENGWSRTLPNRARRAAPGSPASIAGCDLVAGRWPGKGAAEFQRSDDRLRVTVPGTFESLTLLAWVRVDSLPHSQHSLLMTDSFQPGEVHWYLYRDGSLAFAVRTGPGESGAWRTHYSPPVLRPEALGSWVFLASTFDGATGTATHFFNGQPVGSKALGVSVPLRLDTFEIGNWAVRPSDPRWAAAMFRGGKDTMRNFHGRMDEFALLSAPLGAAEIQRLYENGHPGEAVGAR